MNTDKQFDRALAICRKVFEDKMKDYGPSWRIMRPTSVTDQMYIKAKRIRSIEETGEAWIDEGVFGEFVALVNYGFMALIQLELPSVTAADISSERALQLYTAQADRARELMVAKNHDYGEAWRDMRISSYTDIILTKLQRIKQIEDNDGHTTVSEGVAGNYLDIVNYSLFALIQLKQQNAEE